MLDLRCDRSIGRFRFFTSLVDEVVGQLHRHAHGGILDEWRTGKRLSSTERTYCFFFGAGGGVAGFWAGAGAFSLSSLTAELGGFGAVK